MDKYQLGLLRKLYFLGKWNKNTILTANFLSGFPSHEIGILKTALKQLIKIGYLNTKPTEYGLKISLNIRKQKEIMMLISSS